MKVREVVRLLTDEDSVRVAEKGNHRPFKRPVKPRKVNVPGKMSDDLPPGTLKSLLRQAGLESQV